MSLFPCAEARCRGVSSPMLVAWTRAPRWINISTILVWPPLAAQWRGENWWSSLITKVFRWFFNNKADHRGFSITYFEHISLWKIHLCSWLHVNFILVHNFYTFLFDSLMMSSLTYLLKYPNLDTKDVNFASNYLNTVQVHAWVMF